MLPLDIIKQNTIDYDPGILKKEDQEKFRNLIGKIVINLSDVEISTEQEKVLEKGLTFCPSPGRPDYSQIWLDFKGFHRKLELKKFFSDNPTDEIPQIQRKFTPKSNWRPPVPNKTLETFYRAVNNDLIQKNMKYKKLANDNLTKQDRDFLQQLKENPLITIKKPDKGSAVVIMNTTDYLREGYKQLNDQTFYQNLDHDPTKSIATKINKVILETTERGLITPKMSTYLTCDNPKPGRFYLLTKIHKKGIPGRPICSSIFHPTNRIGKFVDEHIKRYVPKVKSYVRDTQDIS
jgi:hypothetical protein